MKIPVCNCWEILGELKEIIPISLSDAGQFLKLASLVKALHFYELLNTNLVLSGMCLSWHPRGDTCRTVSTRNRAIFSNAAVRKS